jgi:hypothetical protein
MLFLLSVFVSRPQGGNDRTRAAAWPPSRLKPCSR